MKIVVIGATGVLGRHVIPRLLERGHEVRAVVRQESQVKSLQAVGVQAVLGDILEADSLIQATSSCDAALHLATAIPKPGGSQDWSINDRIRREGTRNLLAACAYNRVRRYIQQSIIFLYGDYGLQLVDESAELRVAPYLQSAADMEAMVQASELEWLILRGGSFYGPGTALDDTWRKAIQEGHLQLPGEGSALTSLIHVVDMAWAVVRAVEEGTAFSIFNVVDDEPVSFHKLYSYVATLVNGPEPKLGGQIIRHSLGCSNTLIKAKLNWTPVYPTYRSGFMV
jgi:2-alkyl-3-oxoalkanoate reductase